MPCAERRHTTTLLGLVLSLLLPVALLGCSSREHASHLLIAKSAGPGHLLIAGGAIKDDNAAVYTRFLDLAGPGARIGIIPTASGVENPGASTKETLQTFTTAHPIDVIPLYKDDPARANDTAIAAQVRACRGLWFTGGAQSRIIDVFRHDGHDSPAYLAAKEVLAAGGVIAGSSAGAAMMSDPMIRGGRSADALANGRTESDDDEARGVAIGPGMGFFPYGLTDQHFLQRGRLGRLIVALELTDQVRGYGVSENSAIDVDLGTHTIEAMGTDALTVVDRSHATREGSTRRNIRLSLLQTGDRVNGRTGEVRPTADKTALRPNPDARAIPPQPVPDAWRRLVIAEMVRDLAQGTASSVTALDPTYVLRLTADDKTRFYADPQNPARLCAVGIRLDLEPRPSAAHQ